MVRNRYPRFAEALEELLGNCSSDPWLPGPSRYCIAPWGSSYDEVSATCRLGVALTSSGFTKMLSPVPGQRPDRDDHKHRRSSCWPPPPISSPSAPSTR